MTRTSQSTGLRVVLVLLIMTSLAAMAISWQSATTMPNVATGEANLTLVRTQHYSHAGGNVGCPNCKDLECAEFRAPVADPAARITKVEFLRMRSQGHWYRCQWQAACGVPEFSSSSDPKRECKDDRACRICRATDDGTQAEDDIRVHWEIQRAFRDDDSLRWASPDQTLAAADTPGSRIRFFTVTLDTSGNSNDQTFDVRANGVITATQVAGGSASAPRCFVRTNCCGSMFLAKGQTGSVGQTTTATVAANGQAPALCTIKVVD